MDPRATDTYWQAGHTHEVQRKHLSDSRESLFRTEDNHHHHVGVEGQSPVVLASWQPVLIFYSFRGWLVFAALFHFPDHSACDLERIHPRRHAGVHHRVSDGFRNLLFRQPIVDCTADMCPEFWPSVQRHQNADVQQRSLFSL